MKRNATGALPSMFFLAAALSACTPETVRSVEALRPDQTNPERFVCEPAGTRPTIPPEYRVDWTRALAAPTVPAAVEEARQQHMLYVGSIRTREGVVAGYIVQLEGRHFICFNNMEWQRQFYRGLDQPG